VQRARDAFETGRTRSIDFREVQLKQLLKMYEENTTEMIEALAKDLRKVSSSNLTTRLLYIIRLFSAFVPVCSKFGQRREFVLFVECCF
jgi:acyl-CoA reductase-like NAD-dependent aldehyde dehydrogenase